MLAFGGPEEAPAVPWPCADDPVVRSAVVILKQGKPQPVCRFRGDELTGPEREKAGVGHGRMWFHCELGKQLTPDTPPGVVCPCKGCGPGCGGYEPGEEDD